MTYYKSSIKKIFEKRLHIFILKSKKISNFVTYFQFHWTMCSLVRITYLALKVVSYIQKLPLNHMYTFYMDLKNFAPKKKKKTIADWKSF